MAFFLCQFSKVYNYLLKTKPTAHFENTNRISYHIHPKFLMKFLVVGIPLNVQSHPEIHGQRNENKTQLYNKNNLSLN